NATNQDGSIVVGQTSGSPTNHGFRWDSSTGYHRIDPPDQIPPSDATAISADGSVMAGFNYALSGSSGFRWTEAGGFVSLDPSGDPSDVVYPNSMNSDGSVIVGTRTPLSSGESHAFFWDQTHGMRSLDAVLSGAGIDLSGWTLNEA